MYEAGSLLLPGKEQWIPHPVSREAAVKIISYVLFRTKEEEDDLSIRDP